MEIEKTLYRVHERIMTSKYTNGITQYGFFLLVGLGLFFVLALIMLETRQIDCDYTKQMLEIEKFDNSTLYTFIVNRSDETVLVMNAASRRELIGIRDILADHNFSSIPIQIDYAQCYGHHIYNIINKFTSIETLLINSIVNNINGEISLHNNNTNETWYWSEKSIRSYKAEGTFGDSIESILTMCRLALGIFIQSSIASLYIKMTIICAPCFIILMIECMSLCGNRELQPEMLIRAFPWMGIYMNVLIRNQKSKVDLITAFIFMLMLFYFVYLSSVFLGTFFLFFKSIPKGLDEDFFGMMALFEFASMLFLRTRSSMEFTPRFIIVFYYFSLFYIQQRCYGFFYLSFYICLCLSFGTFAGFIHYFEIPAITWNPLSPYTPSLERPRCQYQPLFQMGWQQDIPQLWTMFYPLRGRRYFRIENLALVDRNMALLQNVLAQDIEMGLQNQQNHMDPEQQALLL